MISNLPQMKCDYQPRVIGLTGGIGSGKSLVRKMFEQLGVPCIDADNVARAIHQNATHPATRQIADAFPGMITDTGTLKKGSLPSLFAIDQVANRRLKAILKPHVMEALSSWSANQNSPYVIWESALILEESIPVDRVLVVDAQEEKRVERIRDRNPDWSDEQIRNIIAVQLPRAEFRKRAQDIISNDQTEAELKKQVEYMHVQYITLWG
jgi:dephospho-CoA kinase